MRRWLFEADAGLHVFGGCLHFLEFEAGWIGACLLISGKAVLDVDHLLGRLGVESFAFAQEGVRLGKDLGVDCAVLRLRIIGILRFPEGLYFGLFWSVSLPFLKIRFVLSSGLLLSQGHWLFDVLRFLLSMLGLLLAVA